LSKEKICYVIMPFSPTKSTKNWDKVYEKVFRPAIEKSSFNYVCRKSEIKNVSFSEEIIKNLKNSDLVLADLTDFNANVMWELGIRHTLSTKTIMICQKEQIDNLPSDIRHFGVIGYGKEITDAEEFKEEIEKMLSELNSNPDLNTSPVRNVLNAEDLILSSQDRNKTISNLNGLLSELLFDLNFAEKIEKGESDIGLKTTTLGIFTHNALDYLLSTNYVSASKSFYLTILIARNGLREINKRLDMILLDKRMKQDHNNTERIKEKIDEIIQDIKNAIKETTKLRNDIRKGIPEFVEPPTIFFKDEHEKLLE